MQLNVCYDLIWKIYYLDNEGHSMSKVTNASFKNLSNLKPSTQGLFDYFISPELLAVEQQNLHFEIARDNASADLSNFMQ